MWNGASNTESSSSVVLRCISRPLWILLSLTVLYRRVKGNGRVSEEPLKRHAETRMCATTQLCISKCSSWSGYWFLLIRNSWWLERVSLWGPVIRPAAFRQCVTAQTVRGDGLSWRCYPLLRIKLKPCRKHVTSARLCCFKHLRVVYPTSQPDGGKERALWNALVLLEALRIWSLVFSPQINITSIKRICFIDGR